MPIVSRSLVAVAVSSLVFTLLPVKSFGANAVQYVAYVQRVLYRGDGNFGNCMAQVSRVPAGLNCLGSGGQGFITFDCTGDFASKASGESRFSMAQLALVSGNKVEIYATDDYKHNGYCYAYDFRVRSD